MNVFVLSADRKPLTPCHAARARQLMREGRAAVLRRYPFTIILKDRVEVGCVVKPLRLKLDPGSRATGIALVEEQCNRVVWAAELHHRGHVIRKVLQTRGMLRRNRRNRNTWYRAPRFSNRTRQKGWLAPSLRHRVETVMTWVERLRRFCFVTALSVEDVKFDTQKLQNPEMTGVEYQKGELAGYDVREYLLEKWHRKCAYCGATSVPLQEEHIHPICRGGSNRVSNLTLSCRPCNEAKGKLEVVEFLKDQPRRLTSILRQSKSPLKDAAAVNTTRRFLVERLGATGLPIETGSSGQTKMNRETNHLPKGHWVDAACVGRTGAQVTLSPGLRILSITAHGHGKRRRCRTNAYGFPVSHAMREKRYLGYQTGDHVEARVPRGKHAGRHVGRVAIRHRPSFRLNGFDVHVNYLHRIQRADGYSYGVVLIGLSEAGKTV